jgi:hypothetical protein
LHIIVLDLSLVAKEATEGSKLVHDYVLIGIVKSVERVAVDPHEYSILAPLRKPMPVVLGVPKYKVSVTIGNKTGAPSLPPKKLGVTTQNPFTAGAIDGVVLHGMSARSNVTTGTVSENGLCALKVDVESDSCQFR